MMLFPRRRPCATLRAARAGLNLVLAAVAVFLAVAAGWRYWDCRGTPAGPPSALDRLSHDRLPAQAGRDRLPPDLVGMLGPLPGHPEGLLRCVAVSADGHWLATGGRDGVVRLWDAGSLTQRAEGRGHVDAVLSVAFSPDGRWLASGGQDDLIRLWRLPQDADEGTVLEEAARLEGHAGGVMALAFAADGRLLASGDLGRTLRLWDAGDGPPAERAVRPQAGPVLSLAFAPGGRTLAAAVGGDGVGLWDVGDDGLAAAPRARLPANPDYWVRCVAFTGDGRTLATADGEGNLAYWDADRRRLVRSSRAPGLLVGAAFAPDGRHLLTVRFDGTVSIYRRS
jgi:WD40 repeat protein